jgi:hypothetical protein
LERVTCRLEQIICHLAPTVAPVSKETI